MAEINENTLLMLHFDGTDGSTTITDSSFSKHTVTANGNAQIDTAQSKFGGASLKLVADGDYISIPESDDWTLDVNSPYTTISFTIDFWVRFNVLGDCNFFSNVQGSVGTYRIYTLYGNASKIIYFQIVNFSVILYFTVPFDPIVDTWYHMAFVREGGYNVGVVSATTWHVFINGTEITKTFISGDWGCDIPHFVGSLIVGAYDAVSYTINGWIDEFRWTKGEAIWTADFTPPALAYTSPTVYNGIDNHVVLMMHCEGINLGTVYTDDSKNIHLISNIGTVQTRTADFKFGTSSMYFDDEANDYLQVHEMEVVGVNTDCFNFANGDFTVDFWVKRLDSVSGCLLNYEGSGICWATYFDTDGTLTARVQKNISPYTAYTITNSIVTADDTWHHVALIRSNNTLNLYLDGAAGTSVDLTNIELRGLIGNNMFIGAGSGGAIVTFYGYMDEIRVSKGVARWTAAFTPPTQPYSSAVDIPTLQTLVLSIRDLLNEDSASFWPDAELLRYINDGERDIAIKTLCLQHIDALTTTGGTRTVGFLAYKTMFLEYLKSATFGTGVQNIFSTLWGHTPGLGTDPQNWFERDTNLYIEPIPASTLNLNAYVADYPTNEMSADDDYPEIPVAFRPLIVLYVLAMCLFKDRRYAEAMEIYSMYTNELLYQRYTLVEIIPDIKAATNFHEFNKVT